MNVASEHRQSGQKQVHLPKVRVSIRKKAVLQSMIVTAMTALALSLCAFLIARSFLEQRIYSQLSSVVHEKKELIEQRISIDRERTATFATRRELRTAIQDDHTQQVLQGQLLQYQEHGVPLVGIVAFSSTGYHLASIGLPVPEQRSPASATELVPIFEDSEWKGYSIYSPIRSSTGVLLGVVAMRYSTQDLLNSVLSASSIGKSGEVILGMERNGEVVLINHRYAQGFTRPLSLGSLSDALSSGILMAGALVQHEGIAEGYDYAGENVFAAYRQLPSLGWGIVVKVAKAEAFIGLAFLYIVLTIISILLLGLSIIAARILARRLTDPIVDLSNKVKSLRPGQWNFERSVNTGDEVEVLDAAAEDMASRLKSVYEHMESVINERTADLKQQYLKDRIILSSIEYGIVMVDVRGCVTEMNATAEEFLLCNNDDCPGQDITKVLDIRIHQKRISKEEHPVYSALQHQETVRSQPNKHYSIMRSDSIIVPVHITVKPILDGDTLLGAIAVFQDMTEERRVDYLKSEFISLASHQLRTPLSSMQWYIELMNDEGGISEHQKEYIREMENAGKRMSKLIDALLHAARLEGGDITPHKDRVDLTALMKDLSEEFRTMAKDKGISCTIHLPTDTTYIETDSVLLHVVFKNLFSNAVKYTLKEGKVGLSMEYKGDEAYIAISDTGVGIPAKERIRLFERLFRASNVRKMDTDGNGLGLYISKMVIENLGGRIEVQTEENAGSIFTVVLPLEKREE